MTLGPGCITDPFPLLRRRFPHGSQLLNFSLLSLVSILTLRFLSSFCSHIKISRWCKYCSRSGRGDGELRRHFSSSHFTSDTVPVSEDLRPLSAGYLVLGCFRCKHSLCGCTASHPRTRMFRRLVWPLLGSAAPQASLCVHWPPPSFKYF